MAHLIRLPTEQDAEQVQAIYAPVVQASATSFELEPPDAAEMGRRIQRTAAAELPWVVYEQAGRVLGYAYAARHRERAAYQWSVDASVYILADARGTGIGRSLYTSLFAMLALQGFQNVYAGVALPNPASVGLHERMGFRPVGIFHSAGYKLGKWHDVGWWELSLREPPDQPERTLTLAEVQSQEGWKAALDAGLPMVRL